MGEIKSSFYALAEKLRRSAAVANPPHRAKPWKVPPAWQASTAYSVGQMVSNSGNWYVALNVATSGSVGPTGTTAAFTESGASLIWSYFGPAAMASDDADAPSMAGLTTTAPTAGGVLPNFYGPISDPTCFTLYGGTPEAYASTTTRNAVFNSNVSTTERGLGAIAVFETNANVFALTYLSSTPALRVIIDGRYAAPDGNKSQSGNYYQTFTIPGARKFRTIEVRGGYGDTVFGGVWVGAKDTVRAPSNFETVNAVFVGDSMWAGSSYGPFLPGNVEPQLICDLLGWRGKNFSKGGTGHIAKGVGSAFYTFGERIPQVISAAPDVVVSLVSTNDLGTLNTTYKQAVKDFWTTLRAGLPKALFIQLGIQPIDDSASAAQSKTAYLEQAAIDAVTELSDPRLFMVPYRLATIPLISGSWNNSGHTAFINSGEMLADTGHGTDLATIHRAEFAANGIRRLVLPGI